MLIFQYKTPLTTGSKEALAYRYKLISENDRYNKYTKQYMINFFYRYHRFHSHPYYLNSQSILILLFITLNILTLNVWHSFLVFQYLITY
jgi:hypothetical protein